MDYQSESSRASKLSLPRFSFPLGRRAEIPPSFPIRDPLFHPFPNETLGLALFLNLPNDRSGTCKVVPATLGRPTTIFSIRTRIFIYDMLREITFFLKMGVIHSALRRRHLFLQLKALDERGMMLRLLNRSSIPSKLNAFP